GRNGAARDLGGQFGRRQTPEFVHIHRPQSNVGRPDTKSTKCRPVPCRLEMGGGRSDQPL
ncbi:MAG: hypothetical protein ACTHLY_11600, partial [Pseudolabrys sp.]